MKIETYKKIILGIGLILLGLGAETFSQYYYFDNGGKTYQQGCNETVDIRVNTNGQNARAGRFHLVLDPTTTIYEMSDNVSTLRSLLVIGSSQTFLDWSAEIIPSWKSGTNKTILQIDRSNATTDYNGTNGLYATIKFKPIFNVNNYDIAFGMEYNGLATGSDSTIETTLSKAGGIELINPSQQNLYRTGTYQVLQEPCVADTNKPTISNLSITNGSTKKSHISGLSFSLDDNEGVSGTGNVPYIKTDGSAWTENIGGTISNQYGIDPNTLELQLSGNGHSIIITNTTPGVSISWDGKTWQNNGLNANVTVVPETLFEFGIEKKITATFTFKDRVGNTSGLTINFNSPKGPTLISNSPIPGNGDVYVNLSDPIKLGIKDDWAGVDSGTIQITLSGVNGTDYGPYVFSGADLNLSGVLGEANQPDYYINISNHEIFPTSGTIKVSVYAKDMEGTVDTISDYMFTTRPNCSEFQCCDPVLLDLGDGNSTYYTNTGLVISGGVSPTFSVDEGNITGVINCNTEDKGLSVYNGNEFMLFTDDDEIIINGTGVMGVLSGNVLTLSYIIDSVDIIIDYPAAEIITTGNLDFQWHLIGIDNYEWLSGYYVEIYSGDTLITGGFVDGTGITGLLFDGEYEFIVYPVDLGGRTGNTAIGNFSIDTSVPSVVITGIDIGMCVPAGTMYIVTGTFSEAVTGINAGTLTVVNGTVQSFQKISDTEAVWTVRGVSTGNGVLSVNIATGAVSDLAGNTNSAGTEELSWNYDGEGPEFTLDDVEVPECTEGTMTISGVTQVGCASGHESPYSWDAGNTWGLNSTDTAYSGGIGEKIMTVRVRDAFGNYTEKTGKYTWTNVNPSVDNISVGNVGLGTGINWRELSHAQEGACGTGTVEFSGFISSGDHGTCTEEGGIITYTPNIGEQYEGEDSCIFEITDDEGNTATGEITFTGIDTQKPTAELHGGVGERCTSGNTFTVTGTFSEEVLGVTMDVLTGENVNIVDFTGNGNVYEWAVEMQGGTGKVWINSGAIVDVAGNNIEGNNELILGIYDNMKPQGVSLITPEYNQEFNRRSIAFEWSSSVDDGCAGLSGYILNICRDSLCDDIVETIFTNNTGESITLQNNDNYYWRVISVDNYGNKNTGLVSYFIVESNEPICTITQSACSSSSVNLVLTGNKEISILSGNVVWQEVLQDRYSAVISDNIDVWAIVGDFDNQTGYCHLPVTNYDNVGPDFEFEIIEVDEGHSLTINIIASDTGCAGISGYNFGGIFGSGEWQNGSGLFISADDIGKTGGINKEQVISVIDNLGNITTKTGIIRINDIIPVISQNMLVLNGVYTGEAIIDIVGILGAGEGDLGTGDLEVEISGCTNVTGNISGQVLIINLVEDFEGTGSCTVRIKDNEGSYADVDGVIGFVVDTKKPECTGIIFEPEGWTSGDVVNVSLTGCSEPIVSGTITYVFTGNGSYLFEFEDSAGNVGSQLVQFTGFDRESPIFDFNSSSGYECQTGMLYISNAVDSGVGLDDLPYSFDLINRGTLNSKEVYSSGVNEIYLSGYVRDKLGNYGVLVTGYIFNDSLPSATGFSVYALTGAEVNWKELSKASDGLCGDYNMTATVTGGELGYCSISGDILSYIVNVDNTGEDSCSLTIYDDEGNNIDIEVMFLDINNYPYTELVTPINGISMNPGKISFAWSGMGNETFVLSYVYTIWSSDNEYIIEQTGLDISIDLGVGAYRWNVHMKYIDGTTGGLSDTYSFNIVSKPSGGGGGGGGVLTKDNCPDGDFSNSYYDGMCDSNGGTHGSVSVDICGVNASNYSLEQKGAYLYSYVYGITTMCPISTANLDGYLIRSHFAKMISEFAVNVLGVEPDIGKEGCDQFDDIGNLDKELHDLIVTSCELGLMGLEADGLTPSKSFNPNGFVTRAQFGTVLSRLLFGDQYNIKDESKVYTEDGFWYKQHLLALKAYGIMTKIDGDWPNYLERRGRVMLMLKRADNYGVFAGKIPAKNGVKALFDE